MIIIYAYYLVGDGYIKSDDQQVLKKRHKGTIHIAKDGFQIDSG